MEDEAILHLISQYLNSKNLKKTANILNEEKEHISDGQAESPLRKKSNIPNKSPQKLRSDSKQFETLFEALKHHSLGPNDETSSENLSQISISSSPKDIATPGFMENASPVNSPPAFSSLLKSKNPERDIIIEEEVNLEGDDSDGEEKIPPQKQEQVSIIDSKKDFKKNKQNRLSFNEETIREMEQKLMIPNEGSDSEKDHTHEEEVQSHSSKNLSRQSSLHRSRTNSTSSVRSSKSVSFATSSDDDSTSDEWSDDEDVGYSRVPIEVLEYYQYSDDEEPEQEPAIDLRANAGAEMDNENFEWEPATQEEQEPTLQTQENGSPMANTEIPAEGNNDSFVHDEFEVEKLNQILRDHIQLQRDEFYQESYGDLNATSKSTTQQEVKQKQSEVAPTTGTTTEMKQTNVNQNVNQRETYPQMEFNKQFPTEPQYESFNLPIICEKGRTGLQENKDYPIELNSVIAGRYQILEYLGSAAFSKAIRCQDLVTGQQVCIKIIKNNKEFLDQSLDEIRLLQFINANGDPDEKNVLQLYDYFYHKEHLFIVCELLRDNLYEFYKYNRESGDEIYFNLPRLKKIAKQCLVALDFIHSLKLIHCDLKPENILIKSYSRCEVKIIDFGSSCFTRDHLSSYVQSRSYRAPEVILGLPYDCKIDIWSLGCILAELWTGRVLLNNESIPTLLARVMSIMGPFDKEMLQKARYSHKYFTKTCALYEKRESEVGYTYLKPKRTTLKARLKCDDPVFVDFISKLLTINPTKRPTAAEALQHPFVKDA